MKKFWLKENQGQGIDLKDENDEHYGIDGRKDSNEDYPDYFSLTDTDENDKALEEVMDDQDEHYKGKSVKTIVKHHIRNNEVIPHSELGHSNQINKIFRQNLGDKVTQNDQSMILDNQRILRQKELGDQKSVENVIDQGSSDLKENGANKSSSILEQIFSTDRSKLFKNSSYDQQLINTGKLKTILNKKKISQTDAMNSLHKMEQLKNLESKQNMGKSVILMENQKSSITDDDDDVDEDVDKENILTPGVGRNQEYGDDYQYETDLEYELLQAAENQETVASDQNGIEFNDQLFTNEDLEKHLQTSTNLVVKNSMNFTVIHQYKVKI